MIVLPVYLLADLGIYAHVDVLFPILIDLLIRVFCFRLKFNQVVPVTKCSRRHVHPSEFLGPAMCDPSVNGRSDVPTPKRCNSHVQKG